MEKHFPYEISADENENREINKHFIQSGYTHLRVGPKKYMLIGDYEKEAANIYNMPLKSGDVFVVSYPRSGTTWTQELVWLVANDLDYIKAAGIPLARRYIFLEFSMFITDKRKTFLKETTHSEEITKVLDVLSTSGAELVAGMPSPRFIKSHLPLMLLPPELLEVAKVVYVARDPRDVAVSCFHHAKLFKLYPVNGDFKNYWSFFVRDMITWSPFFEHLKEAWQNRHHPNMLFLFYEELSKDLPATIRRVADFFGKKYNDREIENLCDHLKIDNFKKNASVNMDDFHVTGMLSETETFIRKGKIGGWRDYFDEGMTSEAESWILKNLCDTDLKFPSL